MRIIKINPKKSLNKAFLKQRPLRSEIELFKSNLIRLLNNIDEIEREENQKNHIRDFLRDTYYKETNEINTKDTKDLVIHLGKTNKDKVGVIIEAKRPGNKIEMLSDTKPNAKAFQELVLYFLRERIEENNIDIKYLIATNVYEWYIFDASYFEKLFYRNKSFVKQYEDWRDGKKVTKDTSLFYNDIAQPFIENLDEEVPCTFFDIRDYEKILRNENKADDKNLIALQKLLSPFFLLRVPFANDSNSLNEKFYKELLHLIGLEEVKAGSKNIIHRKENDKQAGSLIENAINILITEDSLHKLKDKTVFGQTKDEQLFGVALELSLTWINRILFLKLLEGQLITYHKGNKGYRFLNSEMIHDYDELYKLFHQVLARNINERTSSIQEKYARVPYLNSSLFEISDLEDATIKINSLDNSEAVELISTTVLKDEKKKNGYIPALEYLFKFLDAYDFASEGGEDIAEDNKTIINASVLGKVFEKINGYKDGSIFTPGFITMYMARQSLRLAVVQKFNEYCLNHDLPDYKFDRIEDIYNIIGSHISIEEANIIINSLRICDPAVGSGHFLVSCLNELIVIKSELGILIDKSGKRLRDYEIVVDNDELIISDDNGIFEYNYQNRESQRVQETIFNERQAIIENCLFGVDINPNSVKICRLRLWIELLKSSYYKAPDYTELETLPNIDINIKCGNSLISRYALDADLKKALQKSKWNITSYRLAIMTYRNARSKDEKRAMEKLIDEIKNNFEIEIQHTDKRFVKLSELKGELFNLTKQVNLFDRTEKEKKDWNKKVAELTASINKQEELIEEIKSNTIYKNAFEWRFEFPEVLDDNGDFVGFDVVIGNPPYIRQEEVKQLSNNFEVNFKSFSGKSDIYVFFYEHGVNILKDNGIINFITSGKFFEASYGKPLINFLIKETEIKQIVNFKDLPVFEGVTAYPLIYFAVKNQKEDYNFSYFDLNELPESQLQDKLNMTIPLNTSKVIFIHNDFKFVDNQISSIINKSRKDTIIIKEFCGLPIVGVKTGFNDGFISDLNTGDYVKPYVFGRDIKRYQPIIPTNNIIFPYNNDFSIASFNEDCEIFQSISKHKEKLSQRAIIKDGLLNGTKCWYEYQQVNKSLDYDNEYIVYPNVSLGNNFSLSKGSVIDMTAFLIKSNSRYLLAILNSRLISFLMNIWSISRRGGYLEYKVQYIEKIPIKNIPIEDQKPFIALVERILETRQQGKYTTDLENQIDQMVYKLYDLTEEEIKIVEGVV